MYCSTLSCPHLSFFIPGKPQGKGRPRFAKTGRGVQVYTPTETTEAETRIKFLALEAGVHLGPKEGPVKVNIVAFFAGPPEQKPGGALPPKPDLDNIVKLVLDALNGTAYHDDAQVVELVAGKTWAGGQGYLFDGPGVVVEVTYLEEN